MAWWGVRFYDKRVSGIRKREPPETLGGELLKGLWKTGCRLRLTSGRSYVPTIHCRSRKEMLLSEKTDTIRWVDSRRL